MFKKKKTLLKKLLPFYRDIFINWNTQFSSSLEIPASLLSQFLWFNKYVQIAENPVCLQNFLLKILIFYLKFLRIYFEILKWP